MSDDLPDFFAAGGWQGTDDEHPPDKGTPAYRAVYKTLKTFLPEVNMTWPNLIMRAGAGSIARGGFKRPDALPLRREGQWLLPQPGTTVIEGTTMTFRPSETKNYEFAAWEETVEGLFFVEFILHTTEEHADRRLAEGRSKLGSLKTLIELSFGPRVLGSLVTEGLGEVFPDGHFNRNLASDAIGNEWQMGLAAVTLEQFSDWTKTTLASLLERPREDKDRTSLACEWYWRSTQTSDLVTEYLELWFVVEVIAMPDTADVRPVRERLAAAFGPSERAWQEFVGRHYGRRSKLVHGNTKREVEEQEVESLRDLVQALLELEFGIDNPERGNRLRLRASIDPDPADAGPQ
jgi:Apea-like HEPN